MVKMPNWIFFTMVILFGCLNYHCKPNTSVEPPKKQAKEETIKPEPILDIQSQDNQKVALEKMKNFQFDSINGQDILALEALMKSTKIDASDSTNQLTKGSILVYRTTRNLIGKMEILEAGHLTKVKTTNYDKFGEKTYQVVDKMHLNPMQSYDLDYVKETLVDRDFIWEPKTMEWRFLVPKNGSKFFVMTKK